MQPIISKWEEAELMSEVLKVQPIEKPVCPNFPTASKTRVYFFLEAFPFSLPSGDGYITPGAVRSL